MAILDVMSAGLPYDVLQRAVPIHPTVSELIPTMLGEIGTRRLAPGPRERGTGRIPAVPRTT